MRVTESMPTSASGSRWWLPAGAGVLVALAVPGTVRFVEYAGRSIPQDTLARDWSVGVLWAVILAGLLLLAPVGGPDRRALVLLWIAKCGVTLGFMLLYESRYALDAYFYYRTAAEPSFPQFHLGGTAVVEAGAWLHNRIVPDSYHAIKVTCSMLGLGAVYLFYRAAVHFRGVEDVRVLYFLGLFPSVLFWSSIFGKDPIALLGIAAYVYGVVALHRTGRWRFVGVAAAGVLLASVIRLWLGPILLFPLVVFGLRGIRGFVPRIAFLAVTAGALGVATSLFAGQFALASARDVLSTTGSVSQAWAEGGSGQRISADLSSFRGMAAFAPKGAFAALFRPLPGEIMNPFGLLAGVENLFLLGLLGLAVLRFRFRTLRDPLVLWGVVVVATWALVYGFVSYQNLGAAVRFRLQILPLLLGVLWYLAHAPRPVRRRAPSGSGAAAPGLRPVEG